MPRKRKILCITYLTAALLGLLAFSLVSQYRLQSHARAARYSSFRAFEETVASVDLLSAALEKGPYVFDGSMKSRLCGEIYASALAAEAAMSTLPFSTQELEQLSAFLNRTGDYVHTLSGQNPEEGFARADADALRQLAVRAGEFLQTLQLLQSQLAAGQLQMDSRQQPVSNVGAEESPLLSGGLLDYEQGFDAPELPDYDGRYSRSPAPAGGDLSEEEMRQLAADYAGVSPGTLRAEFAYEGEEGRRCYSAGDLLICVSPAGVQTMGQSRLVSEQNISLEQAEQQAAHWLEKRGLDNLQLTDARENGAIALLHYAAASDGVLYPENRLQLAIAMDDGSLYSFNAQHYREELPRLQWELSMEQAAERLPEELRVLDSRRLIRDSPSGIPLAVYEMDCTDPEGEELCLYLDAKTGDQVEILVK